MKSLKSIKIIFFAAAAIIFVWSCEDNKPDDFGRKPHDPSKPVVIDSFEPDSGGMATKVFITGSNFGSDPKKIQVYFNDLRAPVIGSDGDHLYVSTPRQPGRKVTIKVIVEDGKPVVFENKQFLYRTMATITTVVGRRGTTALSIGSGGSVLGTTLRDPRGTLLYCIPMPYSRLPDWLTSASTGSPLLQPVPVPDFFIRTIIKVI